MSDVLGEILNLNGLAKCTLAEPFAGGAGASLKLLYLEETSRIVINDADPSIFAFWWSTTRTPDLFQQRLRATPISVAEWRRQREIYRSNAPVSRLDRGFATFYLNRCNRSGIIRDGSVIGGLEQSGTWKISARFNKATLEKRLGRLAEYRSRIDVSGVDGIELIDSLDASGTFFFIDPPYMRKGQTLYQNALDPGYHARLASLLRSMCDSPWVLTYDDCQEVRDLYADWAHMRPFALRYSAAARRSGHELLITPKWMRLPSVESSRAIAWEHVASG